MFEKVGAPDDVESYIQETGRRGRDHKHIYIYIYIWTPQPITLSRCACGGNNDFRLGRDVVGRKGNIVNQPCFKKVMDFFCIDDVILHTKIELVTNTDITETEILSCLPLPKLSFA